MVLLVRISSLKKQGSMKEIKNSHHSSTSDLIQEHNTYCSLCPRVLSCMCIICIFYLSSSWWSPPASSSSRAWRWGCTCRCWEGWWRTPGWRWCRGFWTAAPPWGCRCSSAGCGRETRGRQVWPITKTSDYKTRTNSWIMRIVKKHFQHFQEKTEVRRERSCEEMTFQN